MAQHSARHVAAVRQQANLLWPIGQGLTLPKIRHPYEGQELQMGGPFSRAGLLARLEGAKVRVEARVFGDGEGAESSALIAIESKGCLSFAIRPADWKDRVGRWFGLVRDDPTGQSAFDDAFVLASDTPSDTAWLFGDVNLRKAVYQLFLELGVEGLQVGRGQVQLVEPLACLRDPDRVLLLLRTLLPVALACRREALTVRVLGERQRRNGWMGSAIARGRPLCPWCRDEIDVGDLDLVACAGCSTVHHAECFGEAGVCTIFGCEETRISTV